MGKIIDAAIGRIEAADSLDSSGYLLGKAISRTGQVIGRPSKRLANALHGRPYGHPVHPIAVTIPIGTWTLASGWTSWPRQTCCGTAAWHGPPISR